MRIFGRIFGRRRDRESVRMDRPMWTDRPAADVDDTRLRLRAEHGARLLDEKMPGWHTRIDLETLDVASPTRCVAGQLGGFSSVMLFLNVNPRGHGFDGYSHEYGHLTRAWRHEITRRREGGTF